MNKMIHFGIPSALPGLQNEKNEQNDSFRHAFYKKNRQNEQNDSYRHTFT